jgi:D-amino peptidase
MRVLVSVDMEGIGGVTGRQDVSPGTPSYERFRRWMTREANAVVEGCFDGGATSVVVNDSHGLARNLLYEELDERAELISGYNKPLNQLQGIDGADAVMFVGYHARAGTAEAILDHTKAGAVTGYFWLNGMDAGELDINAAVAGCFGVPIVLVAGDDKLVAQAAVTCPQAQHVVVKEAISELAARLLPRKEVLSRLREAAETGVRNYREVPVTRVEGLQVLRIRFTRTGYAESAARWPTATRIDTRTIELAGTDLVEVFRAVLCVIDLARAADR